MVKANGRGDRICSEGIGFVLGLPASLEQYHTGLEGRGKVMKVITDVVQLVLHYSKHIGGVLDILRATTPTGFSKKPSERSFRLRVPRILNQFASSSRT
jgi:hypothetical protein